MAESISIDKVTDGMIVAEPVVNNFGQTILKAGVEIKSKQKMLLKTWNIESIKIKSSEDEDISEFSDNFLVVAEGQFMKRLSWEPSNIFEEELVEIGINNLVKKMQQAEKKG